ncbi:MAG: tyrosine-type recombinase/integrase [Thiobacillus sp.]|nr:MAG: hypothetical protein B7X82_14485 [Hydrogenophilales bacterium 17-64-65]
MATFSKRKSGWWQARIRRDGHPALSKTFETKAAAEAWTRAVESDMDKGAYRSTVVAESTTFSEIADRFEHEFAPHHYRGQGWKHKLAHLRAAFGDYFLAAITPARVAAYRDDRLRAADPRYKKDPTSAPRLSPATVKTEIDLLSKVLDVASKEFGIPLPAGNPVASIRKPAGGKARDRRLTVTEWGRLMDECGKSGNNWLKPAVLLSVETAMRQGELLGIEWKAVDFPHRLIMLSSTKNGEARAVPLSSAAVAILEGLPRSLRGRAIPQGKATIYSAFKRAAGRAGIGGYTWHDLRHEALSRLAERGDLSLLEMAAMSGHKTLQMLKRYTHLRAENLAKKLG